VHKRKNILLILSDQEQHWDILPSALRRNGLELLRELGLGFQNHHVVTMPCGPSRSTIYSGLHTKFTGLHSNPSRARGSGMSTDVPTVGSMLGEHGYYTAYKGKWHVSVIDAPTPFAANTVGALRDYGFAEYTAEGDPVGISWDGFRRDPAVASDAANWLLGLTGGKPSDQPWFLAVNFVNPHDVMFFDATGRMNRDGTSPVPRLPAPRAKQYEDYWDVDLPLSFDDDLATKPPAQSQIASFVESVLGEIPHEDYVAWKALRSYYFNCLQDLDTNVSTVLAALQESGHLSDTVVVYTSDHGEAAGAHGLREKPVSVYREVVNVPLVVVHPDLPGGVETAALSSAIDLVPTLLSLADINAGEHYPGLSGVDLTPAIESVSGRTERDRRGILFSSKRASTQDGHSRSYMRGYFDGRWKLGRYFSAEDERSASQPERLLHDNDLELYDTLSDPNEVRNLAHEPEHRKTLFALAAKLARLELDELSGSGNSSKITGDGRKRPSSPTTGGSAIT
jgi:arylsulfatase A-like enzyme